MEEPSRADLVARLAGLIAPSRVLRVALDGPDAAGKTRLAAELARALNRPAVVATIDGFHRPREDRYRRGSLSPEGYYRDAYDLDAVVAELLNPLGPHGDRRYRTAVFDHRTDTAQDLPVRDAPEDAVLLVDGVFLLRPELRGHWDLSIVVDVTPGEALRRALDRDLELFGSAEVVRERYERRYFPAQRLYRAEADPLGRADVVVGNDDPERPRIRKWP